MGRFTLLLLSAVAHCTAGANGPEMIHLAFGDTPAAMTVSWSTPSKDDGAFVVYADDQAGNDGDQGSATPTKVPATSQHFRQRFNDSHPLSPCPNCIDEWLHTASLAISPARTYTYWVGGSGGDVSSKFNFTSRAAAAAQIQPTTFAVYGDMGIVIPKKNSSAPGPAPVSPSLALLTKEVMQGKVRRRLWMTMFALNFGSGSNQPAAASLSPHL